MFTFKVFLFLLIIIINSAKSEIDFETMCNNDYRNLKDEQIDVLKHCSLNVCIEKCCGDGEMFSPNNTCINKEELFQIINRTYAYLSKDANYSKVHLYSWDGYAKHKLRKNFVFIRNRRHINCTAQHAITNKFFILEDGSIRMQDTSRSRTWSIINHLTYCVEYKLTVIKGIPQVKLLVREYYEAPADDEKKSTFVLIGMLISSFFLLLVLIVYCLLPKLQNLIGLVLMAYTLSILVTFLVQIVIQLSNQSLTSMHCKMISPVQYFAAISSFFWLNVMSFDVWWSLRGHRKRCEINRRGERVKFMWYCLYAWGVAFLMTVIVTILDNIDLEHLNIIKPPFDNCLLSESVSFKYYLLTPMGIIIAVNIILFILTVYNIWLIKRAVLNCHDSRSSRQDTNRFLTYLKLSVVMGVSWSLDLIPAKNFWLYFLASFYNLYIGVVIFFLFIFNKSIFIKLCKRFNLNNSFTQRFVGSQAIKSASSRTTRLEMKDQSSHDTNLLENCPKNATIINSTV